MINCLKGGVTMNTKNQPAFIHLSESLHLVKFDVLSDEARSWMENEDLMFALRGDRMIFSDQEVESYYANLAENGELYYIEILHGDTFHQCGSIALIRNQIKIIIDPKYQNQHIGTAAVEGLLFRATVLGIPEIFAQVRNYNTFSLRLFQNLGFKILDEADQVITLCCETKPF